MMKWICLFEITLSLWIQHSLQSSVLESRPQNSEALQSILSKLTVKQMFHYDRFKQLANWGFEAFDDLVKSFAVDSIPAALDSIISDDSFEIIDAAIMGTKSAIGVDDVAEAIRLAEIHSAGGFALEKMLQFAGEFAIQNDGILQTSTKYGEIRQSIFRIIQNASFPIRYDKGKIGLEGLTATEVMITNSLYVLLLLADLWFELRINYLTFYRKNARILQAALKPGLTSLSFENCSFDFDIDDVFEFNFSELKNLVYFEFSSCRSEVWPSMWETIEPINLTYLDISNCTMGVEYQDALMSFLLKCKQLHHLNVSNSSVSVGQFPKITGKILELDNLQFLDLAFNVDFSSFVVSLAQKLTPSKLEHLDLSADSVGYNFQLFCQSFDKMPKLMHLALNCSSSYIPYIADNIAKLGQLEKIIFGATFPIAKLASLVQKIKALDSKSIIASKKGYFKPEDASQIVHFQNVDLSALSLSTISSVSNNTVFGSTTHLAIDVAKFINHSVDECATFFAKFQGIKLLHLEVGTDFHANYLLKLMSKNSIEEVSIQFYGTFSAFGKIREILLNCKVKRFAASFPVMDNEQSYNFSDSFGALKFWNELQELTLENVPLTILVFFLRNVKMPMLYTLRVNLFDESFGTIDAAPIDSIRNLSIGILRASEIQSEDLTSFFELFPKTTYLTIQKCSSEMKRINWRERFPYLVELNVDNYSDKISDVIIRSNKYPTWYLDLP